jgi:hypothetical protein
VLFLPAALAGERRRELGIEAFYGLGGAEHGRIAYRAYIRFSTTAVQACARLVRL